jgi:hypothetical protein
MNKGKKMINLTIFSCFNALRIETWFKILYGIPLLLWSSGMVKILTATTSLVDFNLHLNISPYLGPSERIRSKSLYNGVSTSHWSGLRNGLHHIIKLESFISSNSHNYNIHFIKSNINNWIIHFKLKSKRIRIL